MAKAPDFRRNPAPTRLPTIARATSAELPPEIAAAAPQLDPSTPVLRGQVVISDYTRAQLTQVGWKEGDPIPGDLGQRLKEIQDEYDRERAGAKHEVPAGWQPPKLKLVQLDQLPPEKQQEISQYLSEYKQHVRQEQALAAQQAQQEAAINPAAAPSVQDAHRAALSAANQVPGFSFINDLPPVPEGKTPAGAVGISPVFAAIETAKAAAAAPPPTPASEEKPAETGVRAPLSHCPRCTWDLRMAFNIEATDEDKMIFRTAILGGGRFQKEVSALGGDLVIRFRSLTVNESRLLREQLRYDVNDGKILGDAEFMAEMWDYRLVMGISQLRRSSQIIDIPTVSQMPYDPPLPDQPRETVLVPLRKWFYEEVVPTESLARIVREQHQQFNRLLEYLETMSQDPNFFTGIALQR